MKIREVSNGRRYVVLSGREAREIGVENETRIMRGRPIETVKLPARAQAARLHYTIDEAIRVAELTLAGARWCEYRNKHFLIVLPWSAP